ncbi:hypothetical protein BC940DRAFT_236416 [Gongronella butleri]|nr:hypothetical protein BC940DRAFT_236416 [Gongronella butleri]
MASSDDHKKTKKRKSQSAKYLDDDEKRRNFLERNRQAALKCRQRKKQWLTNLQAKVEYLTNDNEQLQMQGNLLREELIRLRRLLWTHKDCHPQKQAAHALLNQPLPTTVAVYPAALPPMAVSAASQDYQPDYLLPASFSNPALSATESQTNHAIPQPANTTTGDDSADMILTTL